MLHRTDRFTGDSLVRCHQDTGRKSWVSGHWLTGSCPAMYQSILPQMQCPYNIYGQAGLISLSQQFSAVGANHPASLPPLVPLAQAPTASAFARPADASCWRSVFQLPVNCFFTVPGIFPIRGFRTDRLSTGRWIKASFLPPRLSQGKRQSIVDCL